MHGTFLSDFYVNPVVASSLMDYFFQSNFAGQVIVIILLGFSLLAWGAMFCKKADLSEMKRQNSATAKAVAQTNSVAEAAAMRRLSGPYAEILRDAASALEQSGAQNAANSDDKNSAMTFVDNALQRSLSRQLMKYESGMILLGTVISGAPFLGLLGTAWGVMDCFGSMSAQASVTLQQLAPGVAGALLTTVAGLFVAIPAVFGYNYLTNQSRELMTDTENFASLLSDIIEMRIRTVYSAQPQYAPVNPQQYPYAQQPAESAPRAEYQYPSQPQAPRTEYAHPAQPQAPRSEYAHPVQPQAPRSEYTHPTSQPQAPRAGYAPNIQQQAARAEQVPPPVQFSGNAPTAANQQKAADVKDFANPETDSQNNADSPTRKSQIIDFSLDDDDSSPTPPRDFDD
ncbi:MAG TPA: MotA/TolQ/ExbB proton channel family protein [Candidatus Merdousia gallistercoris]|nr:MotA/TolQ/ExbB proton channel family protein [Candidatus Merdousia gallistercoris]